MITRTRAIDADGPTTCDNSRRFDYVIDNSFCHPIDRQAEGPVPVSGPESAEGSEELTLNFELHGTGRVGGTGRGLDNRRQKVARFVKCYFRDLSI